MKQRLHTYAHGFCDTAQYGHILKEMCPVPKEYEMWDYDSEDCRLSFYVFDKEWNVIFQKEDYINISKACETAKLFAVSYCIHPYSLKNKVT